MQADVKGKVAADASAAIACRRLINPVVTVLYKTESQTRCHLSGFSHAQTTVRDVTTRLAHLLRIQGAIVITVSLATGCQQKAAPAPASAAPASPAGDAKASTLEADVAHLKDITPSQSHTMIDVGYHMSNLWFAAQHKNWDLAAFEVDETRNRIRWTIRINPTRKKPDGEIVDIKSIFDGIDATVLPPLKDAVAKKDMRAFEAAYRTMLEACYSCHKASAKPYLRPMIPTAPPQTIINYDPNAKWPQ